MADRWAKDIEAKQGLLGDSQIDDYLDNIGQRLAKVSQRPGLKYSFKAIKSFDRPGIAAFTVGGGRIYVLISFLRDVPSEAALAFTIGHEIGHNAGYHLPLQMQRRMFLDKIVSEVALLAGRIGESDWEKLVREYSDKASYLLLLEFSREDEKEADLLGVGNAFDAGWDPTAALLWTRTGSRTIMQVIDDLNKQHPSPEESYQYLSQEIKTLDKKKGLINTSQEFMQMKQRLKELSSFTRSK